MPRHYPNWLQAYLTHAAHSEAPEKFHFWTGIGILAGAVRRRVWIDQTYFQWTPNFYMVFVGPPGIVTKSTTINIGQGLLRRVPDVIFGPQSITWQALLGALKESQTFLEIVPGEFTPMSAVTFTVSELGTFLDPSNREQLDFLTSLWDGQIGVFDKVTKTQGSDMVENPWINVLACTTPTWLRANVSETIMGGGLASRIVWIWGARKRHLVSYVKDHIPSDFEDRATRLVEDLIHISELQGEMCLSVAAKEWGTRWYKAHYDRMLASLDDEALVGYIARKQTHLHKIAMVLSLAQRDTLEIVQEDLELADKLLSALEPEMHRVFDAIKATPQTRLAQQIITRVNGSGPLEISKLYREFMGAVEWKEFSAALNNTVKAGMLEFTHGPKGQPLVQRKS